MPGSRIPALLGLLLLAASPAAADEVRHAVVAAVVDGLTLQTEAGEIVRLTGLHVPPEMAAAARAALEAAFPPGSEVRLVPVAPGRDRYGRTPAVASGRGGGAQTILVGRGLALVGPMPGTPPGPPGLRDLEKRAAAARAGLWADPAGVRADADDAGRLIGRYGLVEGRVLDVGGTDHHVYLNFGRDWRRDFTLRVRRPELEHVVGRWVAEVDQLAGRRVLARGFVIEAGGPLIELSHPEQIEVLP